MQYIAIAALVVALIAIIVAAVMYASAKSANKDVDELKKQLTDKTNEVTATKATSNDNAARLEKVISDLKSELAEMEKDLAANRDPAVVRARLSNLLRNP